MSINNYVDITGIGGGGSGGSISLGAFGSSPNADAATLNGDVLTLQPASASYPGGVSTSAQTFAGQKFFQSGILIPNGTAAAPGLALYNSTGSGLYLSGTNKLGIAVNGVQVFDTVESSSGYGNAGIGGPASISDNYPLLIQRGIVGSLNTQTSNSDTSAGSSAHDQIIVDNGNNVFEMSVWTAATITPAIYAGGAGVLRFTSASTSTALNIVSDSSSSGTIGMFAGSDSTAVATFSLSALTLNGAFNSTSAQSTLTGSAGTAVCSQPFQGSSYKKVIVYLSGYTDTGTQSYTYPTAFSHTPFVSGLTAGVAGATASTTAVTFTVTTQTGLVFIEGY